MLNPGRAKMCIQVNYKKCLHSKLFHCFAAAKCRLTILSEYGNCVLCFDKEKDTRIPPCPNLLHFCEVLDGPVPTLHMKRTELKNDLLYQQYLEEEDDI